MTLEEKIVEIAIKYYAKYTDMVSTGTLGGKFLYEKLTEYYDARKELLDAIKELNGPK